MLSAPLERLWQWGMESMLTVGYLVVGGMGQGVVKKKTVHF